MRCKLLNLVNEAVFEMNLKLKSLLFGIWKIPKNNFLPGQ